MSFASSMNINVSSPTNNGIYPSNPVSINASSDEIVNWTVFLDNVQVFIANNANNLEYNSLSASENDPHILKISAKNSSVTIDETRSFSIDTIAPAILSQIPANNSNVPRGSVSFSVSYIEANLNYTKLYWKAGDSAYTENLTECSSGTCTKTIDFSSYSHGTNISYYFSIVDKTSKSNSSSVYTFKLIACTTSWNCTEWGACSGGTQTRTCTKICENGTEMPSVSQGCSCTPNWVLGDWSSCSGGTQTRTYTDSNSCGNNTGKPADESRSCSDSPTTNTNQDSITTNAQNINYFLSSSQLGNGSLRTLRLVGDKITFKIKNESHALELRKIFSDKVSIKISSTEQYVNLTLNEAKKFELTGDNYYDVLIVLKKLNSSEVDILLNVTNEKVPETAATSSSTSVTASLEVTGNNLTETTASNETASVGLTGAFLGAFENMKNISVYFLAVFFIIILGLIGTTVFMILRKRKHKRWGKK